MKTKRFNVSFSLMLLLFLGTSAMVEAETWESVKKKEVSKSFPVGKSSLLYVDNRYGNITITHWNKSEASIRVEVESAASREQDAQRNLDRVKIDLNKTGDKVSAVTTLTQPNQGNSNRQRLTINYFISIPSGLDIELSQRYGNINLPSKNEGESRISVRYGNLSAGDFTKSLWVEAKYSNVSIDDVVSAYLDLAYCGDAELRNGKQLDVESKYSTLRLGNIGKLNLDKKYGNLKAREIRNASLEIKYSDASIERIVEELNAESLDYGTLRVYDLDDKFKQVDVSSRYGTLELRVSPKAAFTIDAERVGDNLNIQGLKETRHTVEDKTTHYVEINGGGSRKINFNGNRYGSLRIKTK